MSAAYARPKTIASLALALALVGAALVSRVSFDANILRLLPRHAPGAQAFRSFIETFGSLDHLYVEFDAVDDIGDHRDFVDAYVAALRSAPEIESVDAQLFEPGKDWTYLSDRVMFLLGPAAASAALARFQPAGLDAEILHARDLLSVPNEQIKAYVRQDPLGLLGAMQSRMAQEKGAIAFDPTQEGYVSRDGHSRLIIVKPRGAPFDSEFCRTLFARLTNVERQIRASTPRDDAAVTIKPAGAYRVSLESERLIRRDGIVNSVGSLVLLLVIVLAAFRTPWMLLFGTIPLALAALLSLGLSGLIKGSLSPATSGSAGMLFGLGIDGVVVLYIRYLEEREAGRASGEAITAAAGTASSVFLAQATTVATFLALLLLDFPTLEDLGALVGVGMLFVCPLTFLVVPALLARRQARSFRRPPSAPWLGDLVTRRARLLSALGVILTIGLGAAAPHLRIDTRLERLQAQTAGADFEREIAKRFGLPEDVLLALNSNADINALLETDRRLTRELTMAYPAISVNGPSLFLPDTASQSEVADLIRSARLDAREIEHNIAAAGERAGFRPDTFAPFLERLPRVIDPEQRITYDGLLQHGLGPIIGRFVTRVNGEYRGVTYIYPPKAADLHRLDAAVRRVDARLVLTGVPVVNEELGNRFASEFTKGIVAGTAAVVLLIYAVMRSWKLTGLALLPTAAGFIWSAGLLALAHVALDLFSMFAALTFVGIAVDYGIYVLYRYAVEARSVGDVLSRTGAAVGVACLTALVGFGTLVFSSYPPLRLFGVVSIVTLTCCLAAALLFLPALLVYGSSWSRPAR